MTYSNKDISKEISKLKRKKPIIQVLRAQTFPDTLAKGKYSRPWKDIQHP